MFFNRYPPDMPALRLTRRRLVRVVLLVLVLGGGYLWWLVAGGHGRITKANFDRVRLDSGTDDRDGRYFPAVEGMSLDEVVAILGPYKPWLTQHHGVQPIRDGEVGELAAYVWYDGYGYGYVVFANGQAHEKRYDEWDRETRLRFLWGRLFHRDPPFLPPPTPPPLPPLN
jgi:hypothetical protein